MGDAFRARVENVAHALEGDLTDERASAVVAAMLEGEETFGEVCERFGISRKQGYKWKERYDEGGVVALAERSRAPHSHPHAVSADVIQLLVNARKAHPTWDRASCEPDTFGDTVLLRPDEALRLVSVVCWRRDSAALRHAERGHDRGRSRTSRRKRVVKNHVDRFVGDFLPSGKSSATPKAVPSSGGIRDHHPCSIDVPPSADRLTLAFASAKAES